MKIRTRFAVAAGCALALSYPGFAQNRSPLDQGYWRPGSSTAHSITGDIAISDAKISIGFNGYVLAQIRALRPVEARAAFDLDDSQAGAGNLYRTSIPGSRRFLHHNTLCGSDDVQWVATWVSGGSLLVALFSGAQMPQLTPEVLANSSNLCGTFTYVR